MIYSVGADVGKDDFEACLLKYHLRSQTSEILTRKTFKNTSSGFKAFIRWTEHHSKKQPAPVRCTMEATGVYYEPLALFLAEHYADIHLSVVLPSKAKKFNASQGLRSKTDKIDAYGLALMGSQNRLPAWGGIDPFWRALRQMTRTKAELQDQLTDLTNKLHAQRHSGIQVTQVQQSLRRLIGQLKKEIEHFEQLIDDHLDTRAEYAHRMDCLESITGVGRKTIAAILAETTGFERFTSRSQLMSFSGYDVVIKQSGKWTGKPKLSKQGSKYIRKAMYMPATTIVRCKQGPVYQLYQRLLAKHGVKMKAHVAVQKKLLGYMYILWNKGERFDPGHIRSQQAYHNNVASPEGEATVDTSLAVAQ